MKPAHVLLDAVIAQNNLRNDSHLAEELGYRKGRICEIRKEKVVSDSFRCAIVRRFNMTLKQVDALAPPVTKEK